MKKTNNLYTFIFEFSNSIHISQIIASDYQSAPLQWAKTLDYTSINGVQTKMKNIIIDEIKSLDKEMIVRIQENQKVWGLSILPRGHFGILDFVETENFDSIKPKSLYTFFLLYNGGTYISQIKAFNEKKAIEQWIHKITQSKEKDISKNMIVQLNKNLQNFSKVDNKINVWNLEFNVGKQKGRMNFIKTKE